VAGHIVVEQNAFAEIAAAQTGCLAAGRQGYLNVKRLSLVGSGRYGCRHKNQGRFGGVHQLLDVLDPFFAQLISNIRR